MSNEFRQFDDEMAFAEQVHTSARAPIARGATDSRIRRERIRTAILECELEDTTFRKYADGRCETYRTAFERLYGESLEVKQLKGKRA
jgi:hypothetical protein